MAKNKIPSPPEQEAEEECLHCAIVALVEARIAAGGADAADLAALIVESLVDLILRVPRETAQLLAHTLSAFIVFFRRGSGRRRLRIDALAGGGRPPVSGSRSK